MIKLLKEKIPLLQTPTSQPMVREVRKGIHIIVTANNKTMGLCLLGSQVPGHHPHHPLPDNVPYCEEANETVITGHD